ncbi:DUF58 domain-containing protein [Porphyromonas sp.]|uniref:DUF58 domain-containing protein n=1 Tax=Porphyromonas sp. TaxID=1924944 RepID=UPI0026DB761F|nr:DUF58 domain-containing protein [Porphyromonas sp.]MDO4695816.1 DUF58 domain-containing protein [Porphyromonas sp.]MDO4771416.1 DUF58 domain-containing protein [Porphyromonas sp.]
MITDTKELLQKIRRIEIKTKNLSRNIFAGEYRSAFKGRGMAFSEVREYRHGDDVHDIDWNVTARYAKPYIKVFEEERELTVLLLVDVSSSGHFGTHERTKRQLIAEIAGTLAFSCITNNDKVGVLFFSDRIEKFIPPAKGRRHVLHILREILQMSPVGHGTDISKALIYANNMQKKHCSMFVLSDFINQMDYASTISVVAKKHDIMAVQVYDPHESNLPDVGLLSIRDAETQEVMLIDSSSKRTLSAYRKYWDQICEYMQTTFSKYDVSFVSTATNVDYVPNLIRLFSNRKR